MERSTVDNEIRDRVIGRHEAAANAAAGAAAPRDCPSADTRPATHLPEPGPDAEPVVVCAWCPSLHILKLQRREQDVVVIYWQNKELRILRNGINLKVSHGICVPCRERMKREQ
jgi:hypothetical protein